MTRENRITSVPDTPPPVLYCPKGEVILAYRRTVYADGQPAERWDFYRCSTCGDYKYRHGRRRLSLASLG